MKDSKFIELLNLYVDHQISPADAALLEAEIQQKPERRQIYRQYCQMQKACVTLAENFRSEAPAGEKVIEMSPAPRRMAIATYAMGFAAAAACIALVVVNRPAGPSTKLMQTVAVAQPIATPVEANVVAAAVQAPEANRTVLHPAFSGIAKNDETAAATVAVADHVSLDWMNQVQLQRVPAENLWFETRPTLEAQDLMLRSARPYQGQVESTAFIFPK